MSRNSGGLAATLIGGVVSSLLCVLLAQIAGGLPESVVETLLGATPEALHPYLSELGNGFHHDLNTDDMPTAAFLVVQFALWLVMWSTGWHLLSRPATPAVLVSILGFAVLFRAILIPAIPIHASDFYRYLWDGKSTVHGVNPYLYEPAAVMLREARIEKPTEIEEHIYQGRTWTPADEGHLSVLTSLRDEGRLLHDRITAPYLLTSSPPLAQGFFALSNFLFQDSVLALKLIITAFDLGVVVLLLRLLRRLGMRRSGVIFYAWSPLVLVSFANSAHYDAIPVFFLFLAISLALRRKNLGGAVAVAAAGLTSLCALVFTPVMFRRSWRHVLIYLFIAACVAAAFTPFVIWQKPGISHLVVAMIGADPDAPNLAGVFLGVERACATLVSPPDERHFLARLVCGLLFLIFLIWHSLTQTADHRSLLRKCSWVAGALFLFSSSSAPWQLTWMVPFLCAFPRPSWLILMFTIQAFFLQFQTDYGHFGLVAGTIPLINLVIWGLFFFLWLLDPLLLRLIDRPESVSDPALPS